MATRTEPEGEPEDDSEGAPPQQFRDEVLDPWEGRRQLVRVFYDFQKTRLAAGLRIDKAMVEKLKLVDLFDKAADWEEGIARAIAREFEPHPMFNRLQQVRGIGPLLAAGFIAEVECVEGNARNNKQGRRGIAVFDNPSELGRFCGLGVVDGRAEKAKSGEVRHYNLWMKTHLWKVSGSFVKQPAAKSYYRRVYDEYKAMYVAKWTPWCGKDHMVKEGGKLKRIENEKGEPICFGAHQDAAARRATVKRFVIQVWLDWRARENLPTGTPYSHGIQGHERPLEPLPIEKEVKRGVNAPAHKVARKE